MDLSYNFMRFGPKKRRIKIVHLKKPVTKGLAGLIESNLFPQRIAMVVDSRPLEDLNYNYMCLNYIGGRERVEIWMEPDIFYGIKRGDPMARTSLFHELGHQYLGHLKDNTEEMEAYDEARVQAVINGQVIQAELDADQFAVDYLGRDYVIRGLSDIRASLAKENAFDEEQQAIALKEMDLRIEKLQHVSGL